MHVLACVFLDSGKQIHIHTYTFNLVQLSEKLENSEYFKNCMTHPGLIFEMFLLTFLEGMGNLFLLTYE